MHPRPQPLTAAEFFELKLDGGSMNQAHKITGLAYTTVLDAAKERVTSDVETLRKLEEWSRTVEPARERGVYISAAKTLGLADADPPAPTDSQPGH